MTAKSQDNLRNTAKCSLDLALSIDNRNSPKLYLPVTNLVCLISSIVPMQLQAIQIDGIPAI